MPDPGPLIRCAPGITPHWPLPPNASRPPFSWRRAAPPPPTVYTVVSVAPVSAAFEDMAPNAGAGIDAACVPAGAAEPLVPSKDALLLIQEEEEDARLLAADEDYEVDGRSCVDDDETTLWLRYTKWPARLANHPLDILSASTLQPTSSDDDYVLGDWAGTEFTDAGRARYIAIWKRFICYIFRVWATGEPLRQEIYGVQFCEREAALMESVWEALPDSKGDRLEGLDAGSSPRSQLAEALLQLSITFWTFRSTTGDLAPAVLVHFTGVLGVHRRALAYKSAYSYTPMLSALIWVGRLLLLEYALPLRAYSTLQQPWPARDTYSD
ncbi:hypothetical protein VE01_04423 [Pseudogymnoascus verrucosus]|uniref:Uncharacterized protein n=1 Tax=Pseudogymnoascus verrucosus TaxID=342668 RepID=A0A1B8GP90_9PEZI|nr:uncharacterized protein VE01_04423 [Pseudogymnoascus verrucosus]OBT97665.1 hypothetical protein VE01_04423 [Pseudogymnoascus verrucosus]